MIPGRRRERFCAIARLGLPRDPLTSLKKAHSPLAKVCGLDLVTAYVEGREASNLGAWGSGLMQAWPSAYAVGPLPQFFYSRGRVRYRCISAARLFFFFSYHRRVVARLHLNPTYGSWFPLAIRRSWASCSNTPQLSGSRPSDLAPGAQKIDAGVP